MWMCAPVKATRVSLVSPAAAVYCSWPPGTLAVAASALAGRAVAASAAGTAAASRARRALRGTENDIGMSSLGRGGEGRGWDGGMVRPPPYGSPTANLRAAPV